MARIRTIKPEFWRDDSISSLSPEAALLAIGLLNHADDEGYFNANPKLVEADVFPLRELSKPTASLLDDLHRIGYIQIYVGSDGKRYGHIVNFQKHQVISKKNQSKIRPLVSSATTENTIPVQVQECSSSVPVVVAVGKEQGKEHGKESKRQSRTSAFPCPQDVSEQVWNDYLAVRKAKRSPVTQTALNEIDKEAGKAGWSLEKALSECVARGWVGFKAEWVDKLSNPKLSFAERDELLKRKKWEQMTGREFPEEPQSFWTPGADMELLK